MAKHYVIKEGVYAKVYLYDYQMNVCECMCKFEKPIDSESECVINTHKAERFASMHELFEMIMPMDGLCKYVCVWKCSKILLGCDILLNKINNLINKTHCIYYCVSSD